MCIIFWGYDYLLLFILDFIISWVKFREIKWWYLSYIRHFSRFAFCLIVIKFPNLSFICNSIFWTKFSIDLIYNRIIAFTLILNKSNKFITGLCNLNSFQLRRFQMPLLFTNQSPITQPHIPLIIKPPSRAIMPILQGLKHHQIIIRNIS